MCKSPFLLKISSSETGTVVRYTLDGSEPTAASPEFTTNLYISSTTIIRAADFRDDVRCSDVVTSSYIYPANVLEQPALPELAQAQAQAHEDAQAQECAQEDAQDERCEEPEEPEEWVLLCRTGILTTFTMIYVLGAFP